MTSKKPSSFFQITRSQMMLFLVLGAFIGLVLSIVAWYEWVFVEKMRKKGVETIAKVRGIRKEKNARTETLYLQVVFSTPQQLVTFAETNISSSKGFQKGDTLSILYLPSEPSQIIRKKVVLDKLELIFFLSSIFFTFLCLFFCWILWRKNKQ